VWKKGREGFGGVWSMWRDMRWERESWIWKGEERDIGRERKVDWIYAWLFESRRH
jgi:hypothetical protein